MEFYRRLSLRVDKLYSVFPALLQLNARSDVARTATTEAKLVCLGEHLFGFDQQVVLILWSGGLEQRAVQPVDKQKQVLAADSHRLRLANGPTNPDLNNAHDTSIRSVDSILGGSFRKANFGLSLDVVRGKQVNWKHFVFGVAKY